MADTTKAKSVTAKLTGYQMLLDPILNKGTAFSEAERDALGLHGLLPPLVGTLDDQVQRRMRALLALPTDLDRYELLRDLQDSNETLFYALLARNLSALLPIVYTPTVGAGCENFSALYRRPRGLFLSPPHKDRLDEIFSNPRFDDVEAIVVTDGERILGLGDQGAGGMGISIGKLSLYTACAGIRPSTTLPIILDVGTENESRLIDPLYIGWRHKRIRGEEYDDFVERFVSAVHRRWPNVLLQWEDFARANATRLLARYRDRLCTFNDDVQGTAAIATGTLLAALNVTRLGIDEQRIVIVGAGSAGCGIASLLRAAMLDHGMSADACRDRILLIDQRGLLVDDMPDLEDFQRPFLQERRLVQSWAAAGQSTIELLDVIEHARPTALIGVSGQPGIFTEAVVRAMASVNERPVIFPLSNPLVRSEADPRDIERWTDGRAVIGTGTQFPPLMRNGKPFIVDQTNNSYVFPGIALGVIAVQARHVSDKMFMVAAKAIADMSPAIQDPSANLLMPVDSLRAVATEVAFRVAKQARDEGLTDDKINDSEIRARIEAKIWRPEYPDYCAGSTIDCGAASASD